MGRHCAVHHRLPFGALDPNRIPCRDSYSRLRQSCRCFPVLESFQSLAKCSSGGSKSLGVTAVFHQRLPGTSRSSTVQPASLQQSCCRIPLCREPASASRSRSCATRLSVRKNARTHISRFASLFNRDMTHGVLSHLASFSDQTGGLCQPDRKLAPPSGILLLFTETASSGFPLHQDAPFSVVRPALYLCQYRSFRRYGECRSEYRLSESCFGFKYMTRIDLFDSLLLF